MNISDKPQSGQMKYFHTSTNNYIVEGNNK